MTLPRCKAVQTSITRWYHCISRCAQGLRLLEAPDGNSPNPYMLWHDQRLKTLTSIFAIGVAGHAVLDSHLHHLVRIDPHIAKDWQAEEVARRWFLIYPPRDTKRKLLTGAALRKRIKEVARDAAWIAKMRRRLYSVSWFMKCLKEPLSRMINQDRNSFGTIFAGRFKSIAILDQASLTAVCVYIDLNPFAAGIGELPETFPHTSLYQRIEHARKLGRIADLAAARQGSIQGSKICSGMEDALWLVPVEDRRKLDCPREGMFEGLSLGSYLLLLDYTSRLMRTGKASVPAGVADIFDRLQVSPETWAAQMQGLSKKRQCGVFLAASRERLREVSRELGVSRVANICGSTAA
jgi:hypothetical protein